MIRKILSFVLCAGMVFSACENIYRDEIAELHKEIDEVKARLDAFCEQTNNNIEALQTMILALQAKDYVTGVVPVVENGVEVGYKITFEKSGEVVDRGDVEFFGNLGERKSALTQFFFRVVNTQAVDVVCDGLAVCRFEVF